MLLLLFVLIVLKDCINGAPASSNLTCDCNPGYTAALGSNRKITCQAIPTTNNNLAVIVGIAVAVLVGVPAIIITICCFRRRCMRATTERLATERRLRFTGSALPPPRRPYMIYGLGGKERGRRYDDFALHRLV